MPRPWPLLDGTVPSSLPMTRLLTCSCSIATRATGPYLPTPIGQCLQAGTTGWLTLAPSLDFCLDSVFFHASPDVEVINLGPICESALILIPIPRWSWSLVVFSASEKTPEHFYDLCPLRLISMMMKRIDSRINSYL